MELLPDDLSRALARLTTAHLGRETSFRADTPSTMTDAAALVRDGAPHGTVMLTDHQTAGRGRLGRTWNDAPGQNLLLSIVWRTGPRVAWPRALFGVAAGTADALGAFGLHARLKWPNDVRIGGRKVAGMIAQTSGDALILGLGLNVNQLDFPDDLAGIATSMARAAGRTFDRADVLAALLNALEPSIERALAPDPALFLQTYAARLDGLGEPIRLRTGTDEVEGLFEAVADDGGLVLRASDGTTRTYHAGDVTTQRRFPSPA